MTKEELEKYVGELSPEIQEKARQCKDMKELNALLAENDAELSDDVLEAVAGGLSKGRLVGKRHGNLVIVKAADDDSNGQNGTDHIKYIARHAENSLFCHRITPFHDL